MAEAITVVKEVKNAKLFSNGQILISNVRGSYVHAVTPWAGKAKPGEKEQTPGYSIVGLLPKKTHKEAKDLIVEVIDGILAEKKVKKLAPEKKFIRNGDDSDKDEYAGHWTVSARDPKRPPKLRDRKKNNVERTPKAESEMFYSGAWFNIIIRPWWQDHADYGKRVNAGLVLVQFVKDDEPFGEGTLSDEAADDLIDAAEDDDLDEDDEDLDDL